MIQIIRIEHKDSGKGLFRHLDVCWQELTELFERHCKFKTPGADGLNIRQSDKEWFCAYKTLEQFQNWILKEEIPIILAHGYDIWLLEVTEYQEGRDQVIFTKESIQNLRNLNDLFI